MRKSIFRNTGALPIAAGFMLMPSVFFAQTEKQIKEIRKQSNLKELDALKKGVEKNTLTSKELAAKARAKNIKYSGVEEGRYYELKGFDKKGNPLYYITMNAGAAQGTGTSKLNTSAGNFNLDGDGMKAHEWDGGGVKISHQEFGGRVTQKDKPAKDNSHSTHVAGTIVAEGIDAKAKGMAPKALLDAYDWTNDTAEMIAAATDGALISNHSYGYAGGFVWSQQSGNTGWHWMGDENELEYTSYGKYGETDKNWDLISLNAPFYLPVKAAGNPRGNGPAPGEKYYVRVKNTSTGVFQWKESTVPRPKNGGEFGFDCVNHGALGKNILTIGAAHKMENAYQKPTDVQMASFSAFGPADDGRIKPDISGIGVGIYSSNSTGNTEYTTMDGTSMASPNVTGSLLLLQEHYKNLNNGDFMKATTLKALAIGTANEAGEADGPDYKSGWGLLNAYKAALAITTNKKYSLISENTLANKATDRISVKASGTQPLVVTMSWADPAPAVLPNDDLNDRKSMLVNDLDIRVKYNGQTFFPWKLNPINPANPATREDNTVDNVEQIVIPNPVAGATYEIEISHKGDLLQNKLSLKGKDIVVELEDATEQDYSLVVTGINQNGAKDLSLDKIATPADSTEFGKQTPVSFEISNQGSEAISGAKLKYTVINTDNGQELYTAVIDLETISGNGKINKIVQIDLSKSFINYKILGEVETAGDEFKENNKNEIYAYGTLVDITEQTSSHSYDFESAFKENGWNNKDLDKDGKSWIRYVDPSLAHEGKGFAVNFPNSNGTNDWLTSNPLKVKANASYRLTFYMSKFRKALDENLSVYWTYWGSPIENGQKLGTQTPQEVRDYQKVTYEFTPDRDGIIYLGFHHQVDTSMKTYAIAVDDVDIRYAKGKPLVAFKASTTNTNTYEAVSLTSNVFSDPSLPVTGYQWEIQPQTYRITKGDLSSKDIDVIFDKEGEYSITLKATNATGEDSLLKSNYIVAKNEAVVAGFNASATNVFEESIINFKNISTGNPAPSEYKWTITPSEGVDFVSPTTNTSKDPVVKFNKPGKYSVKLEATSLHNTAEENKPNFINVKGIYNPVTEANGTYDSVDNKVKLTWQAPILPPAYEEEFVVRALPQGMKVFNVNNDRFTWGVQGVFSKSAPYSIWNQSWFFSSITVDDWVVTPKISAGADYLKYSVAHRKPERYDVYVVEAVDGENLSFDMLKDRAKTKIYSFEGTEETPWSGNNMFVNRVFDIKSYTGKDFYIAFHHRTKKEDNGADLILDDIVVGYGKVPSPTTKNNITNKSEEALKATAILNDLRDSKKLVSEKDIEKYLTVNNEEKTPVTFGVVDVPRLTGYEVTRLDNTSLKKSNTDDRTYEETAIGNQTIYEYNVYALYSNGKKSDPVYVKVDMNDLSTSEVKNTDLKIYPNPSDGRFIIEAKSSIHSLKAEVYDVSGKLIFKNDFKTNKVDLNLTQYPKGTYILNLLDNNGKRYSAKLMIK